MTDSVMDTYRADGSKSLPDVILDFTPGEDKIDLSPIDAIASTPGTDAFIFIGSAAFGHHEGELRVAEGDFLLFSQVDGDGRPKFKSSPAAPNIQRSFFLLKGPPPHLYKRGRGDVSQQSR